MNRKSEATTHTQYRWHVLIWLLIGGIINYLDRANLSIAAPGMIQDLGLTRTQIGLLGTVFSWTYAVMQLPAGWIIDRFGAKRAYAVGMIWWSVATWLTGVAGSIAGLIAMRAMLAIGEAPCWPTSAKITASWFPGKERGFATGIWDSASKWGPALAPALLVALMISFGWRSLFHVTGAVGIVFAVLFLLFYRNPTESRRLSREEFAYIEAGGGGHEQPLSSSALKWRSLFMHRSVWGMIFGYFCAIWLWNIFLVFLPLYLFDRFHVSLGQLGVYASIPWFGGAIGEIAAGWVARKMVDGGVASSMDAKRIVIVCCALLAGACVIALPFVQSIAATLALMTFGLAFIAATIGNAWALAADLAPPAMVASVSSVQNFGGYFGGAFSPVVVGLIADRTGSYSLAFVSGGAIAACAAFFYWFMARRRIEGAPRDDAAAMRRGDSLV
ncbi:MFS transporter [Trinickia caryophylli]|uniref:Sugar phosphate permease n=1 Tax=Trinickia caryophylli TaxID=28094 RepID=A0A1X7E973_TRICW|nr:MFS transporter [Trinickia caryophylli]PMS13013.1 MFS transporter [Trinickia caryophylli]TRX14775.1 MFS transporter [Trinickia caryophylli]WQE14621.1 MFS transporter [Trinickia caryophylli]SMF29693.1 Sugar phosphate permease [Trinickia caryophylli]GLU31962.1 MFS transporter [Trinickia caryophylli]